MKLLFKLFLLFFFAININACSSVPEGARKMDISIEDLSFANINNTEGFKICFNVHHSSFEPMPLEQIKIQVFVNGKEAALYTDNEKKLLPNRVNNHFDLFIEANKLSSVAKNSLQKTPMLQIKAKAIVSLIVDEDIEDPDSRFNQSAEYEGVIHASAN